MINRLKKYHWYEWCNLLAITLFPIMLSGNPLLISLFLHLITDFTCQSENIALSKADNVKSRIIHALCAGSFPYAIKGMMLHGLLGVFRGILLGFLIHFAIDSTQKFNLPFPYNIIVDQLFHCLCIVLV